MWERTPIINGFRGEDRWNRDLPPNVARDGLNVDYSRGSIRRRDGLVRLHSKRIQDGGVEIRNDGSDAAVLIPHHAAYEFSGSFTVNLTVMVTEMDLTGMTVLDCYDADTGFRITIEPGSDGAMYYSFEVGTGTTTVQHTNDVLGYKAVPGIRTSIAAWFDADLQRAYLQVRREDGILTQGNASCSAYQHSGLPWALGNTSTPGEVSGGIVVDELRVWNEVKDINFLNSVRWRELTDEEMEDESLVGYWKFNDAGRYVFRAEDSSPTGNPAQFYPQPPPTLVDSLIPFFTGLRGAAQLGGDPQYLFMPYHTTWESLWVNGWVALELWCRLDGPHESEGVIAQLGDYDQPVVTIKFDGDTNDVEVEYYRDTLGLQTYSTGYTATIGKPFHISVQSFGAWLEFIIIDEDGITRQLPVLAAVYTGPGTPEPAGEDFGLYIGCRYQESGSTFDRFCPITVDDVRLWSLPPGYTDIVANYDRELSGWGSNLIGYWRLNSNDYTRDEIGNSTVVGSSVTTIPRWSQGLVANREPTPILGLIPMLRADGSGDVLAVTPTSGYSIKNGDVIRVCDWNRPSSLIRNHAKYRDHAVFTDKDGGAWRYDGKVRPHVLTPEELDPTDVTVTAGDGTGLTGSFRYRFQYVCSRGDIRGPISLTEKSITSVSDKDIDIEGIPGTADPQVDKIYIYRTKESGAVFYYLDAVDNPGGGETVDYTDDTPDASLVELADDYLGVGPPSLFPFVHLNTLFLGNSREAETRIISSEVGYLERFYANNDVWFGRGDGDDVTGAISIGHRALVTKRNSLWLLDGPPYAAVNLWRGCGCVSHGTLAAGGAGIYFLSASGAMVWNPAAGAEPQKLGGNAQKPIWDSMDQSRAGYAVGCYYPDTREYWLSFDTTAEGRVTLVWNEERGSWAKFDLSIDAFAVVPLAGGGMALVGGWRGYVVQLRRGGTDGVAVNETTPVTTFAVTDGGSQHVDVASGLYADGSGLAGVRVDLVHEDGTKQTRVAYHNTSTRLWVTEPWDAEPDNSGDWTLYLGAIPWFWSSPHIRFGDAAVEAAVRGLRFTAEAQEQVANVLVEHWGDGDAGENKWLVLQ